MGSKFKLGMDDKLNIEIKVRFSTQDKEDLQDICNFYNCRRATWIRQVIKERIEEEKEKNGKIYRRK